MLDSRWFQRLVNPVRTEPKDTRPAVPCRQQLPRCAAACLGAGRRVGQPDPSSGSFLWLLPSPSPARFQLLSPGYGNLQVAAFTFQLQEPAEAPLNLVKKPPAANCAPVSVACGGLRVRGGWGWSIPHCLGMLRACVRTGLALGSAVGFEPRENFAACGSHKTRDRGIRSLLSEGDKG